MSGRCFLVHPLPSVADESFLALLFGDGVVRRSVFAGFAARRFALVEMCDDGHAEAVHRAIAAVNNNNTNSNNSNSNNINSNTNININSIGLGKNSNGDGVVGVNGEDDRTLGELFEAHTAAIAKSTAMKNKKNKNKDNNNNDNNNNNNDNNDNCMDMDSGSGETRGNCIAFIGRLHFRGTPLQITPSPIEIEELYSSGGHVPERRSRGNTNMGGKQQRQYNNDNNNNNNNNYDNNNNNTEQEEGEEKMTIPTNRQFPQKRPRNFDAADGTFPTADTYNKNSNNNYHNNNKEMKKERSGRTGGASSQEACRHCGSTAHFTRQCTESATGNNNNNNNVNSNINMNNNKSHTIITDVSSVKEKFPADCCQKCGSSTHFTRHCTGAQHVSEKEGKLQESSTPTNAINTTNTITSNTVITTEIEENDKRKKPPTLHEENMNNNNNKPKLEQRQTIVRTSKDQCKYCGSDLHLSRHCPSK